MNRLFVSGLAKAALLVATTFTMIAATPLQEVKLKDIDGKDTSLKAYSGKVLLVVNVADSPATSSALRSPVRPKRSRPSAPPSTR